MAEVNRIGPAGLPAAPSGGATAPKPSSGGFADALQRAVRLSSHAGQRLAERGIVLSEGELQQVAQAIERARQAGSKEAVVVTDRAALVVAPHQGVVITAMPLDAANEQAGGLMINRIDTVVWVGRTNRETPGSGRTEGAYAPWGYQGPWWPPGE